MDMDNPDLVLIKHRYPMFGASIVRLWGQRECVTYLKELLASMRQGAPGSVDAGDFNALLRLSELHDQTYPHFLPSTLNNPHLQSVTQAFPAVGAKLSGAWGTKDFGPYMTSLLQNNRGDNRQGFPFDILMALHSLAEMHNRDYEHLFPAVDIWTAR